MAKRHASRYAEEGQRRHHLRNTHITAVECAIGVVVVHVVAIPITHCSGSEKAAITPVVVARGVEVYVVALAVSYPFLDASRVVGGGYRLDTVVGVNAVEDAVGTRVERAIDARTAAALLCSTTGFTPAMVRINMGRGGRGWATGRKARVRSVKVEAGPCPGRMDVRPGWPCDAPAVRAPPKPATPTSASAK